MAKSSLTVLYTCTIWPSIISAQEITLNYFILILHNQAFSYNNEDEYEKRTQSHTICVMMNVTVSNL